MATKSELRRLITIAQAEVHEWKVFLATLKKQLRDLEAKKPKKIK